MKNVKNKSAKSTNVVKAKSPGRPKFVTVYPKGEFTMTTLMKKYQVDPATGKGPECAKLTLVNNLKDACKGKKSSVIRVKGKLVPPDNKSGLGRKQYVYITRADLESKTAKKIAHATKTVVVDFAPTATEQVVPVQSVPVETVTATEIVPAIVA